jgi:hypothetical protein
LRSDVTKDGTIVYRASKLDCDACALKSQCCPNMPARKIGAPLFLLAATAQNLRKLGKLIPLPTPILAA